MKQNILLFFLMGLVACKSKTHQKNNITDWAPNFSKVDISNPILTPNINSSFFCPLQNDSVKWEAKNVLNPTALVKDEKVYLLYRAQDSAMTSRIGLAISEDGIHFKRQSQPIFFPSKDSFAIYEGKGGIEDPRIVATPDNGYFLTYTAYDGKTARLCFATTKDLVHFQKHGPVLSNSKYINTWSKSGALIAERMGNKVVAKKINNKYWMYFGDTDLFMAYSTDLLHWEVLENEESKKIVSVLTPRPGYFDSRLVEPGPYALYTANGIVLIYNSSNAANNNDPTSPKFTYAAAQALFDTSAPYKLMARSTMPFIKPDKPYELKGEVNNVCFVEGLVYFKDQWFLYYGTADSKIAVALASDH
jgi:predicted GH43/DUF377 family glycosyl hydrolase